MLINSIQHQFKKNYIFGFMELVQRSSHHNVTLEDTKYIILKLTITVGDLSINIL